MIHIIGGFKKKAKLEVPTKWVRPTSSLKREAIFSIIENFEFKNKVNIIKDKNCLDLFSGSGSYGLEAISRGANFCYFYEKNYEVLKSLEKNCNKICKNHQYEIIKKDILKNNFSTIKKKLSIVFIDPPYIMNPHHKILISLKNSKILENNCIVIIESDKKNEIKYPINYKRLDEKIYRNTKITFLYFFSKEIFS